jgi:hypothetical protein
MKCSAPRALRSLAKVMELQAIGEVFVEPIRTMREWVFCGRCGTKVYSEKRTA